jgi:hypothetical protein
MKQVIFTTILVFCFGLSVFAQNEFSSCPKIEVTGGGVVPTGGPMFFTAKLNEAAKNLNLEYDWTVSIGKISDGQNSSSIKIETTGLSNLNITATVKIKGLSENCANIASETGSVAPLPIGEPYDRYGKISISDELGRFDGFIFSLRENPNSKGFLVMNVAKNETFEQTKRRILKLLRITNLRKFPKERLIFALRKSTYIQTTAWIVPESAEFPECDGCLIINGKDL